MKTLKDKINEAYAETWIDSESQRLIVEKLKNALKEEFNCDGINILQNNEAAAGQTVFHLHFHLLGGKALKVEMC